MPEFSLGGLINFILGLASGFILFTLTHVYLIVRGKSLDKKAMNKPVNSVDEQSLKTLIIDKQTAFKKQYKKQEKGFGKLVFDLSYELVEEISTYHFPDSKYPMMELNIDEIIELNTYISERIDKILDQPMLKNTRNIRVTHIVKMFERKKQIEEQRFVKAMRNRHVNRAFKMTLGALNAFNPAYWVRKLVINTSVDFITKRIALLIIGVVGEETSKVYSKKLFDKEIEFDLVDKELKALEEGVDDEDD